MRTLPLSLVSSLLTLAAFFAACPAWAEPPYEDQREQMPESVRHVETETGGRVLQVRPMQRGNREIYRMKVLTPEGRIRVMQDDPRQRIRESLPLQREFPPLQSDPRQRMPEAPLPSREMRVPQDDSRLRMREFSQPPIEMRGMRDEPGQFTREAAPPPQLPREPERYER